MDVRNPPPGLPFTVTHLTTAQIRTLHTTPIPVVPAPGAGFIALPVYVVSVYTFGTVAFGNTGNDGLNMFWAGDTSTALISAMSPGMLGSASVLAIGSGSDIGPIAESLGLNKAITATNQTGDYNAGAIVTTTLGAAGTGYAVNDTGTITTFDDDATYIVNSIGAGGAVATFTITNPGTNYLVSNGNATARGGAQPGSGSGLTINITAITQGDGTLKVVTYYQVVPVP